MEYCYQKCVETCNMNRSMQGWTLWCMSWEVLLTELFFNLGVGVISVLPPHFELHARNFSTVWNVMSSGQAVLVCSVPISLYITALLCIFGSFQRVYYPGSFSLESIFMFGTSCSTCFMKLFFPGPLFLYFLHSFTVRCEEMLHLAHILN